MSGRESLSEDAVGFFQRVAVTVAEAVSQANGISRSRYVRLFEDVIDLVLEHLVHRVLGRCRVVRIFQEVTEAVVFARQRQMSRLDSRFRVFMMRSVSSIERSTASASSSIVARDPSPDESARSSPSASDALEHVDRNSIVRAWSATARVIRLPIHHVAYVENL